MGYTLSWANRRFNDPAREQINDGHVFPTTYDRRHNLTAVALFKLSKRVQLTGAWVYTSGNPTTLATGRYFFAGLPGDRIELVPVYPYRNQYRLPSYHRLDLGLVLKMQPRHGESDLTFSIYNAYNRRNPYFIYYDELRNEQTEALEGIQAKLVSLFPVIPSVTYNFKF